MSWISTPILTQLNELLQAAAIGSDAAAAAICTHKPQVSVEWLEQARSVFWSQILQMRTPLADLTDSYPDLGDRLSFIWGNLDTEDSSLPFEQRMKYANEFEQLLTQIREKPGFSRFLLPREFSDLQKAARTGPIVILNASQYRCDAFVILHSSLHVVSLHSCELKYLRAPCSSPNY